MRGAILTIVALVLALATARPAEACDCRPLSAADAMRQADLVFFGRAGKEQRTTCREGGWTEQPITVLHVLKGKPGSTFVRKRRCDVINSCERTFKPGEVALVFVRHGAVRLCDGNSVLEMQAPRLHEYFELSEAKPTPTTLPALQVAIARGLGDELAGVAEVPVLKPSLAGTVGAVGSTRLLFAKEVPGTNGVWLTAATSGPVHHVAGEWLRTHTKFETVLLGASPPYQVLGTWVRRDPAREATLEVARLVGEGDPERGKARLLELVQRSMQVLGARGPRCGPAADLSPASLFPHLGTIREPLRACLGDPAWQVKTHVGLSPAMWGRYLLALWGDVRDKAAVRQFLVERKNFARAVPAGLKGKTIDQALARFADYHFAREGYKDKAKPPHSFCTTLAPDGKRALVRHWVEYLHWGYAQELTLTRQRGRWRVRLVMFVERWHNR